MRLIKDFTRLDLAAIHSMTENLPSLVVSYVSGAEAKQLLGRFVEEGAQADIIPLTHKKYEAEIQKMDLPFFYERYIRAFIKGALKWS
jgi:hypothetical protein